MPLDGPLEVRQKCPSSSAKKWHFERPEPRTDPKNPAKHPPKWWGRHLAHSFPFSGEYEANFWKFHFLGLSGALFPLPRTPNFKWSVQWHLWVYKFENCFLGSPNHPEHALRWPKSTAKIVYFWPRLVWTFDWHLIRYLNFVEIWRLWSVLQFWQSPNVWSCFSEILSKLLRLLCHHHVQWKKEKRELI